MKKTSKFSQFDYFIVIIAIVIEFLLGLTYLPSAEVGERDFGIKTMIEAGIGFIGILFIDRIRIKQWQLTGKNYKEFNATDTLFRGGIMFLLVAITQFLTQTFLSVRDYQIALAVIFASPCEEIFFRGLLISIFIAISVKITKKEKSAVSLIGVIISSVIFVAFHTNYYGHLNALMAVGIGGLIFGVGYWWTDDLSAVIFAHLAVNIFASGPLIIEMLTQVIF